MKPLWMKKLVKTIFGSVIKNRNKPTVSRTLQIEPLEIRLTPTTVSNVCGTLFVTGTSGVDNTFIWLNGTVLNIAEPSASGFNLRGNAFNSASNGTSSGVIGANNVIYDVLTINLANPDAADIFNNLTVEMGDGNDVLSLGFDPINGFATKGLDFTTLAATLTSTFVIVNLNGDSLTQTSPTLSGINTLNAGGIVSSYNSDLNIINFDIINNGDVNNNLLTLRASQGSLLIADPNLFLLSDGSVNTSATGTITLNNPYIDPVPDQSGPSPINIEASGDGNRIVINNPLSNISGQLFIGSQTNTAGDIDNILIKSIASNSSINPLATSINSIGSALTIQTLGDVYFEGSLDVNGLNVLETNNFTVNGNVTSSYSILINSQTGNNNTVIAFNKNVVTDYDFTIYNLGSSSSSGAQFYINKDALDLGTTGLIFNVQCNFNAYAGAAANATVDNSGTVTSITVTNPGFGYLPAPAAAPIVTLSGGGGKGATATANIGLNGQITSINITNAGTGYTSSPTVSIEGSKGIYDLSILGQTTTIGENVNINNLGAFTLGTVSNTQYSSATGLAVLGSGIVNSITPDNVVGSVTESIPGAGYTSAPTVSFFGGGGTGAAATAILNADGTISYTVTSQGSGYTSQPTVFLTGGGFTTQASAVATLTSLVGSRYTIAPLVTFVGGGGTGAAATSVLGTGAQAGQVLSYNITNPGIGYTTAPTVILTRAPGDTTGSGASAIARITTINADTVTAINPVLQGSGYTSPPSVTIAGANVSAIAVPVLGATPGTLGQVTSISNIDGGSGYTSPPIVTISAPPSGGIQAVYTANILNGIVTGYTQVSAGSGYTSTPTITITRIAGATAVPVIGNGSGASANAIINAGTGTLVNIVPVSVGSGYTSIPMVSFIGGGGINAAATAVLGTGATAGQVIGYIITNPGSGYTSRPTVILTPTGAGPITSLTPVLTGRGYTSVPTVTITGGGGSGADYRAIISNGKVTSYAQISAGSGYTSAPTVTVTPAQITASANAVLGAGTIVSLTPFVNGLGYTSVPTVTITGGGGSGADYIAVLGTGVQAGTVVSYIQNPLNPNAAGFGYTSTPTVTVADPGTATAIAVLGAGSNAGKVIGYTITDPGFGYTSVPAVTVAPSPVVQNASLSAGGFFNALNLSTDVASTAATPFNLFSDITVQFDISTNRDIFVKAAATSVPIGSENRTFTVQSRTGDVSLAGNITMEDYTPITTTALALLANGALSSISPILSGSGYTSAPLVTISAPSVGGTQATAIAVLGSGAQQGQVVSYTITNPGSGYITTPTVTVAPNQVDATAISTLAGTSIASITPVVLGSGYTSAPVVTFSAPPVGGTTATAIAILGSGPTAGQVIGYVITNAGSGYVSPPSIVVASSSAIYGSNLTVWSGIATPSFKTKAVAGVPTILNGQVLAIPLTTQGVGYTAAPVVNIVGGGGSGATAIANLIPASSSATIAAPGITATALATVNNPGSSPNFGQVTSITPVAVGSNYSSKGFYSPTVTFPAPGATATAIANINAAAGTVTSVIVTNGGTNYNNSVFFPPLVTFIGGGGSGAAAFANVNVLGVVTSITITNPGTGYTSAPQVVIGTPGVTAQATANVVGGQIISYTITNSGSGYRVNPIPTISDPGITATATVTVGSGSSAGTIIAVSVVSFGGNYSQPPLVTIAPPPSGGIQATATAVLRRGFVRSILITNPGSGYDSLIPNITITNPGSGYTSLPTVTLTDPEGDISVQTVTGPNRTFTINDAKTFSATSTIQVKNLVLEALNDPNTFSVGEYVFNGNIGLSNNPTAINAMAGLYNVQILGSTNIFGGGVGADSFSNSGQILLGNNSTDSFDFTTGVIFGQNTTVAGIATVDGNTTIRGNLTPGQVCGTGLPSASAILVFGAQAIATVAGGNLTALVGVVTGSGYTSAPTVSITGGGGLGATATAVLGSGKTAGQVVRYIITNPGLGYSFAPTVTITAPSGTGRLGAILPIDFGSGFTLAPTVIISGGGGTGASALAILGTGIQAGQVVGYTITNSGAGYTSAPTISFACVGILTFMNPLVFDNATASKSATYSPVIIGNKPGANQSQVIAQSGYTLTGNPRLSPSLGSLTATPGTAFTILNQLSGSSTGKFSGLTNPSTNTYSVLNEGDIFYAGNATYRISYTGGTGSSVVLTFVRDTTGGNNFTADVYYNSGVIEVLVTSTGIDVDATILSIFNSTANSITIDAGAGNSIQLTDYTSGNLNVSFGNTQTASIGLNNNIILGLKLLGNVGQDKFILQDLNSKVLLNSAASFGVDVDTSSFSGGEYQDTLTVDGTVKVFGTGNFKTSNNNPVQNLDEIIITSFGVIQSVGSGDILLVANHAPTSTISIYSPPVSFVSPIVLTASANPVLGSGTVISLTPAILGSGYTSVPVVSITGGGGTGATATAVLGTGATAGQVVSYNITNPGSGYTSAPTVTVAPPTSKSSFSLDLTTSTPIALTSSGSVTLIAGQNISMGGNVVRTNGGSININSPVNLIRDSYFTTGNIKADVTFSSSIDENFDLTVKSFGSLNFQGNVGSLAGLGDITTQSLTGLNVLNGTSVPVSINAASFNTAGGVNGDIIFSGAQNYSTLTGLNIASIKRNATVTDPGANGDITLDGAVSLISGAVLNLAHEGALNINANIINGLFTELSSSSSSVVNFGGQNLVSIVSDAGITFNSPVNLGVDTNLQSTNNFGITFNNTLNGANDLAINTTGSLVFTGAVGATAPLNSISTKFTGVNSTTTNNPLQLDVNNTLKVGSFEAMVNGDINMIQDQTYTGNGLTLVTVTPSSTIRLGKIIGDVSSAANVSVSNAGALILNDDIKLGGDFTQGALFTGISLTNAGSNYTSVPTVSISGGNGSGAAASASLGISAIKTLATATAIIAPLTATATATISGGQLSGVNPVSVGGGYVSAPAVTITGGGGTGATAIAVLGLTSSTAGQVVSYIVTNPGSGYNTSPTVTIDAPTFSVVTKIVSSYSGSGYASAPTVNIGNPAPAATAIATISNVNGVSGVSTVVPIFSGANFTTAPFVSITGGGGTGASAIAQLGTGAKAGQIVSYQVINSGSGYITVPTVTVSENSATAIATVSAGTVSNISPVVLGNGYTSIPKVTVSSPGGVTAFAVATINSFTNTVSSVVPILPVSIGGGGGYTSVPIVTITGGGGTGASVTAVLGTGAHAGQVVSYTLTSGGSGYTSTPTVTVAPPGITATATAVLGTPASGTAGQVVSYNITDPGSGYTSVPSVTVDPAGKPATAVAILGTGLNSGRVVDYIVTYPGFGYSSAPVVTLSSMPSNSGIVISGSGYVVGDLVTLVGSGGTPASAQITNVNANGGVTGLTLLSSGNYTSGGLSGLVLISTTGRGKDARVNATGFLQSVSLTSAGSGYTSAPTISFSSINDVVSNGVGATAIANLTSPTGQVYIGNLGNPSTITIKTGSNADVTFTSKTYLNQKLILDGSASTLSDVSFGAIEGGTLSLLPALTIVAGGNLTFNGSIGAANPLGAIDASTNILTSVQSTPTNLGINAASFKFSATGVVSLTAPQHYTGTKLEDGSVFGLDLTNTTSSALVTLGDITTREFFNTQVGSVKIDNAGNGYTTAPTVNFLGGGGSAATGSVFLSISNSSAVITSGGSGYTLNQIVQIVQIVQLGFNNQIIGSAIGQVTGINAINNGITALSILSPGYGFTDLTNLSVISSGFGGIGSGATISATGFITAVDIISGGVGYTSAPTVVFSSGVATATALLAKKSNSVTISNSGPVIFQGDINTRGNFNQIGQGAVTIGTSSSGIINLNSAGGDVFFNTAVVQLQNFVLDSSISSANSGNITFNNSIDSIGFKGITLTSGVLSSSYPSGKILLKGSLGISPMGNIQVNNSNDFSVIGNVIGNSLIVNSAKGVVNFSGAITIRGTVPVGTSSVSLSMETISSASSIVFQNPVITLGNVIIKNAGTFVTTSIADMSIQGSFQQTGAGISSISGDISTTVGGISFAGPVGLSGTPKFIAKNTVSTSSSTSSLVDIAFQNDVNGLGGISLDTTGRVLFLGNVGLLSPLSSIEIVNANYTNPLDLVAVQFNSSASQVTNANKIILPESTGSSNLNGRVIFNGSTNISNAFTTTRSYYDIFFNSNVTFSTNTNFLNGGKVKFSGTTNFTGSATFNNSGTLEASGIIVSAGSLIVQRPLAITNNLQLYLSSSNNSFTSSVSGNSIVTLNSGGTLVLTGNSPQFTGNFVVNTNTINGVNSPSTLQVSAFYNNATVTLNGGTLSGTGRVLNVLSATTSTAIAVVGTGVTAGKIRSITVTNPGSGYVSPPTVTIAAPPAGGTRATATAILGTGAFVGQIVGFSITNSGSGYTFAPSVTVSLPTAGGAFSPGAVLGNLTVGNQLVLGANNTFTTSINGVSPGTFGQTTIISGGSFGINNANLAIVLNTNLTAGNQIPLVNLGGGSSSLGNFTFNGTALTQGASFSISSNGYTNTFTISYTGGDGNDIVLTVSGSTASAPPPGSFTASQVIGVDYGGGSVVQINYTNGTNLSFFAYSPLYTGGVRVALGDVNGDGIDELITGTGVGGGPHIKVFNLQGGQPVEVASFFAFEPTFMGGVNISTGDINGDGLADIIVGAGAGGGPRVKVFSGAANYFVNATKPLMDFFVYDPAFTGGVTVAAGNRDGYKGDEVITGSGFGGGPNIRSFNQFGQMVDNFFAFNSSITSGVFVAAGYVDADAVADIIAGTGFGTPTQVAAFFSSGANPTAIPFVPNFVGGARVGVAMNSSGKQVFAAAAGPGGAAQVNVFNNSLDTTNAFIAIDSLFSGGLFLNTSINAARPSLPNR